MKLQKLYTIKGIVEIISGLHIGMGNQEVHIGGIDNPVIKHPVTNEPYIPGSSMKGKMRTLLEYHLGKVSEDGSPYTPRDGSVNTDEICRIFGTTSQDYTEGPTRLVVRDAMLCGNLKDRIDNVDDAMTVFDLFEGKWETAIDRKSGTAKRGSLRQSERVIPGAEFDLEMTYKVFDDLDEKYLKHVTTAIKLLENDALGGSGSRGYGRIAIRNLTIEPVEVS